MMCGSRRLRVEDSGFRVQGPGLTKKKIGLRLGLKVSGTKFRKKNFR